MLLTNVELQPPDYNEPRVHYEQSYAVSKEIDFNVWDGAKPVTPRFAIHSYRYGSKKVLQRPSW